MNLVITQLFVFAIGRMEGRGHRIKTGRPLVHENQYPGKSSSHGCRKRIGHDYHQTQKLKSHNNALV